MTVYVYAIGHDDWGSEHDPFVARYAVALRTPEDLASASRTLALVEDHLDAIVMAQTAAQERGVSCLLLESIKDAMTDGQRERFRALL